jgi:hypothetical protein
MDRPFITGLDLCGILYEEAVSRQNRQELGYAGRGKNLSNRALEEEEG